MQDENDIHEWEKWGRQDPYFAVITDPRYRSANLDDEARRVFFDSGRHHAGAVLASCRRLIDPNFKPHCVLDFGCGVGRVLLAFAESAERVTGVDVSPAMLDEARRNCVAGGITNVELQVSDAELSQVQGAFDLVHSCIVFQHIDVPSGRRLFARLLELLAPGGIGAIQVTYAKAYHASRFGQPPPQIASAQAVGSGQGTLKTLGRWVARSAPASAIGALPARAQRLADPEMQMNPYPLSELAFLIQSAGVREFHAEFTDHGGELGTFLYFRKPPAA